MFLSATPLLQKYFLGQCLTQKTLARYPVIPRITT
jgi:hypothetical protein